MEGDETGDEDASFLAALVDLFVLFSTVEADCIDFVFGIAVDPPLTKIDDVVGFFLWNVLLFSLVFPKASADLAVLLCEYELCDSAFSVPRYLLTPRTPFVFKVAVTPTAKRHKERRVNVRRNARREQRLR